MKVAAVQFAFDEAEGWNERIDRMLSLVARQRDADLVVLPELWPNGGFTYDLWRPTAEAMSGPLVARLRESAAGLGCVVHAGSFVELHEDGSLTNTSLLLDGNGETLAVYRKIHLFGFSGGEPALMSPGADVVVVDTEVGRVGLTTCYDLRFPELYRLLSDERAELVLIPAAWPASRIDHWSILARARAIENQAVVVAVNTVGTHGGKLMGGRSVIVDARGVVVAEAGSDEQILTANLDLADVAKWRSEFPVQADRRL